jgi:hypothetical protein
VGKPEGKRPLERPRRKWEDNIKTDLKEIWWGGMDLIHLAQDREQWRALVNTVMKFGFHKIGHSWAAERLAASQEGLSSMELVSSLEWVYISGLLFIHSVSCTSSQVTVYLLLIKERSPYFWVLKNII